MALSINGNLSIILECTEYSFSIPGQLEIIVASPRAKLQFYIFLHGFARLHIFTLIKLLSSARIYAASIILKIVTFLNVKNAQMTFAFSVTSMPTPPVLTARRGLASFWSTAHASAMMDTTLLLEDAPHAQPMTLAAFPAHTILPVEQLLSILLNFLQAPATKPWISSSQMELVWHVPCHTVLTASI